MKPIVAIDGPAGSGKSTVARLLALRLGVPHVDTGAMYRVVTLKALREGIPGSDAEALERVAREARIELDRDRVYLDGEDVSTIIRTPKVTARVSEVSAHRGVRRVLVDRQRELAGGGAVVEGRDVGTEVLPRADIKIFLVASREERARRRLADFHGGDLVDVLADLDRRDRLDSEREESPMRPADDAITVDTTGTTAAETADEILRRGKEAGVL